MLLSIGDWFAQNWAILLLIVLAIGLLVPTYLRQRKEAKDRMELTNAIKKGTKVLTTFGVYGVVDSIEDTTDGKVVTLIIGEDKNKTSMKVHINAIGGIDNKTPVIVNEESIVETKEEPKEEVKEEKKKEVEKVEETVKPKKTTSKKKS